MWVKLKKENSYGYIIYEFEGEVISPSKREIKKCDIKWPDGTIEKDKQVVVQTHYDVVSEQGHLPETICSKEIGFLSDHHGLKIFVDLAEVKVRKESIVWTNPKPAIRRRRPLLRAK